MKGASNGSSRTKLGYWYDNRFISRVRVICVTMCVMMCCVYSDNEE